MKVILFSGNTQYFGYYEKPELAKAGANQEVDLLIQFKEKYVK